jgi:C1A family cysteine protease
MMGYDSLFGSHYDLYVVDYHIIVGGVAAAAFNLPDMQCVPMPGTTGPSLDATSPLHDLAALHPGSDAQRRSREREDQLFDEFKQRHGKQYSDRLEHQRRRDLFHHNARFVNGKNRQGLSYKLALNHLADLSRDELRARNNKLRPKASGNGAMAVHERALATEDLPPSFDWRVLGAVSPVKDQAVCGSCWSFGAAQTIEGALFRETGVMTLVSSQALVDCSWDYGNNGCDGGLDFQGYQWIMDAGGIPGTADYPYLGADGVCHATTVKSVASLAGYVNVTTGSEVDLMDALVSQFPVSISIDASHPTFSFYASGVYYEPQCGNTPDDLDHTVLLVGYGTENGQDYWLVKNSWSTYWGDQGYVKMSRLNNNCGVETTPTYVVLKSQRAHA